MLYETTVTVYEKHDPPSFSTFKYRVSESCELDSFSELDYRQAENVHFGKLGTQIDSAVLELPLEHKKLITRTTFHIYLTYNVVHNY
jgi:hypothetical protein